MSRSTNPLAVTPGAGAKLQSWQTNGEVAVGHVQMGVDGAGQEVPVLVDSSGVIRTAPRGQVFSVLLNGEGGLYAERGEASRMIVGPDTRCMLGAASDNVDYFRGADWGAAAKFAGILGANSLMSASFYLLNLLDVAVEVAVFSLVSRQVNFLHGFEAPFIVPQGESVLIVPGASGASGSIRYSQALDVPGVAEVVGLRVKPSAVPESGKILVGASAR